MTGAKHWIVNFARNRSPMTYKQVILFLKGSLLFSIMAGRVQILNMLFIYYRSEVKITVTMSL